MKGKTKVIKSNNGFYLSHTEELLGYMNTFAELAVEYLVDDIEVNAKKNVAIGKMPGPHPHRTKHKDTGNLGNSFNKSFSSKKDLEFIGYFSTDLMYGVYLEMGWVTKRNRIFRYPWLIPAAGVTFQKSEKIISEAAKKTLPNETLIKIRGKMNAEVKRYSRLSGTWKYTYSRGYTR